MIWITLYIVALLAWGYVVAALLADARQPRRLVEMAGMSAALGCGVLPLILLLVSMLGMRPTRGIVLGIGGIAVALIVLLKWTKRVPRTARPIIPRMTRGELAIMLLGLALIGFQFLFIFVAASAVPVIEVDAWNIWGLKAKVLFFEPLSPRPEYFTDLSLSYTHLDYPLLVPMLWAGAYGAMDAVDDAAGKTWLIVPMAGIILLLYSALRDVVDRSRAILLTSLAIGSPAVSRWAGQGVADTTLAVFMLAAAVCIVRWIQNQRPADAIGAGIFAALCIWTKLEGQIVVISTFLVVLLATIAHRARLRGAAAFLVTLILVAAPWWFWSAGLPHTHENYLSRLSVAQLQAGLSQLHALVHLFWIQFRGWNWTIAGMFFLLAIVLNARALRRPEVMALWMILGTQIAGYLVAYLVTPWTLAEIVPVTATRLVMQVSPLAMYLAGLHWREARSST